MIEQSDEAVMIRRYLLGDLDEMRREEVEERVLCESGFAEKVAAAQDHLIDDYVFNGLTEKELESFEKNFILNDERRNKIRVAQAFELYVDRELERRDAVTGLRQVAELWRTTVRFVERHKVWATFSYATIVLLVFLTKSLLPTIVTPPLDNHRARIERQLADLNRHPSLVASLATLELELQPTLLREGGATKKVMLTKDIRIVRLKLEFTRARSYERYYAIVRSVEAGELFTVNDLKAEFGTDLAVILLRIPSELLPIGDYQVELRGATSGGSEEVARFDFRIINNMAPR